MARNEYEANAQMIQGAATVRKALQQTAWMQASRANNRKPAKRGFFARLLGL